MGQEEGTVGAKAWRQELAWEACGPHAGLEGASQVEMSSEKLAAFLQHHFTLFKGQEGGGRPWAGTVSGPFHELAPHFVPTVTLWERTGIFTYR